MVKSKSGKIINIGSMYSFFGSGLVPSYSAAKGAIVQLTKSMAIELAPHNIQVNAIAPGWIETDMTAPVRSMPMNDEILGRTPAGRWGQPKEVAGTVVYLASRASDFVTGTTIRVDGENSWRIHNHPVEVPLAKRILRGPNCTEPQTQPRFSTAGDNLRHLQLHRRCA